MGIGTSTPSNSPLSVTTTGTAPPIEVHANYAIGADFYTHANTAWRGPAINLYKSRGTFNAPSAVLTGDTLGYIGAGGYDGTSYGSLGSQLVIAATEDWNSVNHGGELQFSTTANGTN